MLSNILPGLPPFSTLLSAGSTPYIYHDSKRINISQGNKNTSQNAWIYWWDNLKNYHLNIGIFGFEILPNPRDCASATNSHYEDVNLPIGILPYLRACSFKMHLFFQNHFEVTHISTIHFMTIYSIMIIWCDEYFIYLWNWCDIWSS